MKDRLMLNFGREVCAGADNLLILLLNFLLLPQGNRSFLHWPQFITLPYTALSLHFFMKTSW